MPRCTSSILSSFVAIAIGLSTGQPGAVQAADKSVNFLQQLRQLTQLSARAQTVPVTSIYRPGDAVVTGFSGVRAPAAIAPGVNPLDKTVIDVDGPSLRVIDTGNPGGPPRGQLLDAPKLFPVSARQIGQVFAVARDDATPPNIYVAATSAYGLPIVATQPDADGTLRRLRRGEPGARFMPGQFGQAAAGGGPGSIWKIDGRTGAVSLFVNIPNSGAGLGDIAFDAAHRQFFVSDRSSGLIHRIGLDGALRDTFDHGTGGRAAVGLTPVPDRPQSRLNIQSPAFDPGNPQSWNYPAPARRTFGLAVRQLRLFYALAEGPQVWSVALNPDGSIGSNVTWELSVPAGPQPSEIASILFDASGQIYLAERGAPTGAYDFKALAESGENRVLRFRPKRPDDPPGAGNWQPLAEEYAIGFPSGFRNGNGGIAIGYSYDARGTINRAACGGTLWSTGEQLRNERALAPRLQPGGPFIVDGLQANAIDLVRPQNTPPFESYYVDYDDRFDDAAARGHLGDVDIWQVCEAIALAPPPAMAPVSAPLLAPQFPVPSAPPAAAGECRRGEIQMCCRAGASQPNSLAVTCVPPPPGTTVCPGNSTQVCCTRNANGVCVPRPPSPPPPSSPPSPPPSEGKPLPVPPGDGAKPPPNLGPPGNGTAPPGNGTVPRCPPGQQWVGATCAFVDPTPPPSNQPPPSGGKPPPVPPGDGAKPPPNLGPPGNGTAPPGNGTVPLCPPGQQWVGTTCARQIPPGPSEPEIPGGPSVPPKPPLRPPVLSDCTPTEQILGRCSIPPTSLCQAAGDMCCAPFGGGVLCTPTPTATGCPNESVCCSAADRSSGNCHVSPAPASPPLADNLCPSPWQKMGRTGKIDTCCNMSDHSAFDCRPTPSSGCPAGSSQSGDVCCEPVPGPRGAVACATPEPPPPLPPTASEDLCAAWSWVPFVGLICAMPPSAQVCTSDDDCGFGIICSQGACRAAPPATSVPAPTSDCQYPSKLINGACCSFEMIAAGLCDSQSPPTANKAPDCSAGKRWNGDSCVPIRKKKVRHQAPTSPTSPAVSQPTSVPNIQIEIMPSFGGGGFGGGRSPRGGGNRGGRPSAPPVSKPPAGNVN